MISILVRVATLHGVAVGYVKIIVPSDFKCFVEQDLSSLEKLQEFFIASNVRKETVYLGGGGKDTQPFSTIFDHTTLFSPDTSY